MSTLNKQNMKQFSLKEYLAHPEKKVVTRDGRPARIICTESSVENCADLFFADEEPELTEFEMRCMRLYHEGYADGNESSAVLSSEALRESAAELLKLARKELTLQGNVVLFIEMFEKCLMEAQEAGRKEALKDLPRWKKCEHEMHTLTHFLIRSKDVMWIGAYVKEGQYYISTNDLILKLPGFKEDKK